MHLNSLFTSKQLLGNGTHPFPSIVKFLLHLIQYPVYWEYNRHAESTNTQISLTDWLPSLHLSQTKLLFNDLQFEGIK